MGVRAFSSIIKDSNDPGPAAAEVPMSSENAAKASAKEFLKSVQEDLIIISSHVRRWEPMAIDHVK